jgi:outer membrane protein OmpA-like peptidoglycan-associated protein
MLSMKSFLLAGSALLAAATMMPLPAQAAPADHTFTVAQAQGGNASDHKKKEEKKGAPPHPARPAPPRPPAAVQHKPPPPRPPHPVQRAPIHKPAPPHPVQNAPVHRPAPPHPVQNAPVHRPAPPHPVQNAPVHRPAPPHPVQSAPIHKPPPPAAVHKSAPPVKQVAPAAPPKPPQQQPTVQQKPPLGAPPARHAGPERRDNRREAQPQPAPQRTAPANAPKLAPSTAAPAVTQQQPAKPRDAREFIRKNNNQPQRTIKDVRQERRTVQQNGRVFIHEGDRTIVREHNRTFIRHNEDQRFAIGARDVRVGHRDGETVSIIVRPDGVTIISTTDRDGHLVRRVRRDRNGREFVIIDNRRPRFGGIFLNVPPPRIRIPRDRYIVDADDADEREIYDVLIAPPVEPIEGYYSLAQVRYNAALRDYMPRLDLDIHFDTGSWQITPAQMDRLALVADALNRTIARNPREVFLIEGHTDAVGSEEDNLSLSDRRAEAVAVALTEEFHVPPENLVTQGYGEQELKVPTQGPSRANRRVAVRRITPLIDRTVRR